MVIPKSSSPQAESRGGHSRGRSRRQNAIILLILGVGGLTAWVWVGGLTKCFNALAARALTARDTATAAQWLNWSKRSSRSDGQSAFLEARLARHRQDYEAVRVHLQRAFRLDYPRDLLEREQWLTLAQAGQLRDAEPHLAALLSDPRDDGPEICEAYVNGYLLTYQPAKAQLLLGGWQRDFLEDPLPHVIQGGMNAAGQQWNAAEVSFRKALDLAPAHAEAAVGLADVLVAKNQFEEALRWYRKGETGAPQNRQARLGAARCLEALGKRDEARQVLTALAEEFPASSPVLFALARIELEERNDSRARELLEGALAGDPHNAGIQTALAAALRRGGEIEAAEAYSREAQKSAAAKVRAERLQHKINAQPDDVALRYELGALQLERGSEREGVMWLKSVLELQPDHKLAREALDRYERQHARRAAD